MKFAGNPVRKASSLATAALVATCFATPGAQAQAPYLLPYTIGSIAGGGAATTANKACNGTSATAADAQGDACLAVSAPLFGSDPHDIGVDSQGNVIFIDNGSYGTLRRIDARSGTITVLSGGFASTTPLCAAAIDKYGDGCPANDLNFATVTTATGANANPGTSTGAGKFRGMTVGKNGDVYIADYTDFVIHRISASTGLFTLFAGSVSGTTIKTTSGVTGYSGDGGPATSANLKQPRGVAVDLAGNVYIADTGNNVVRRVAAGTGVITTFAGVGPASPGQPAFPGSSGDLGPANQALFSAPEDVEVDAAGNVFIADVGNNKIRVVYTGGATVAKLIALTNGGAAAVAGDVYTVVGGGLTTPTQSTFALATTVLIGNPRKIKLDSADNIVFGDGGDDVIWFVDATTGYMRILAGQVGVVAGGTYCAAKTDAFGDGCPGTQATLNPLNSSSSMSIAVDSQENLYITDAGDARIRKLSTNQTFPATAQGAPTVQTLFVHFAAADSPAAVGPFTVTGATDFTLGAPSCGAANPDNTVDCLVPVTFTPTRPGPEFAQLVVVSAKGLISSFGISGESLAAALAVDPGTTASFGSGLIAPVGVTQDSLGNTYVADTGNNRVVKYAGATATVVAGTGTAGYTGDGGLATAAKLSAPKSVAVARSGAIFIADSGNNVIRRIDPLTGFISTYGGGGAACASAVDTFGDGCPATAASFSAPAGVTADLAGHLYVADTGNNLIREIAASGYVSLIGGGASAVCAAGDSYGNKCSPTAATFSGPTGIQVDSNLDLFIADTGNSEIREIVAATNKVIAIAGTGQAGGSGNGNTATIAQLSAPTGVSVDAAGNVYIADTGNDAIRIVNSSGLIGSVAGTLGTSGTGILPGSAYLVDLTNPGGVYASGNGTLYILDSGNNRAFTVNRQSLVDTFSRTQPSSSSAPLLIQATSTGSETATLASPFYTASGSTSVLTLVAATGSTGCTPGQALAPGNSCALVGDFSPATVGIYTATYNLAATYLAGATATPLAQPPSIQLNGTGALLTNTSSVTTVTSGTPQYAVPFTVSTQITPASCNAAAPACFPTGTVSFQLNGVAVTSAIVSATGVATATIPGQSVTPANSPDQLVAVYSGDGYYAASSAPTLAIVIAAGTTSTTASASPASAPQFTSLVLSAKVVSTAGKSIPTGTMNFFAGSTLVASAVPVSNSTGIAATPASATSFGLVAGSYALTAVYSGDSNYAASTSPIFTLVIAPDSQDFQINYNISTSPGFNNNQPNGGAAQGTAQGSTAQDELTILPSNTLSGNMTFACSGMPQYSVCTFQPTTLTFAPVSGAATSQQLQVTLWTDIAPGVNPAASAGLAPFTLRGRATVSLASLLGWPVLALSLAGLFGFRKRLRQTRLLATIALCGLLAGSSVVLTGCFNAKTAPHLTPTGTYNVTVTATGPNGTVHTLPIVFTVAAGIPGQE